MLGRGIHVSMNAQLTAVVSDVHLDGKRPHASWRAFRAWHRAVKPARVIISGDFVDLAAVSRFDADRDEAAFLAPELKQAAREVSEILAVGSAVTMILGNHEGRWNKLMFPGKRATTFRGIPGLDLPSVWRSLGLPEDVAWADEVWLGLGHGRVLVRHGDTGTAAKGPVHLAATLLRQDPHYSQVVGHHHRGELRFHTSHGITRWAAANPCLTGDHGYAPNANWVRGFTVLQHWAGGARCTPHLVPCVNGEVAWAGKVYGGRGR